MPTSRENNIIPNQDTAQAWMRRSENRLGLHSNSVTAPTIHPLQMNTGKVLVPCYFEVSLKKVAINRGERRADESEIFDSLRLNFTPTSPKLHC
jgi:hypothetical protein